MSWSDLRTACFVVGLCVLAFFGVAKCDQCGEACEVWNDRIIECSHDEHPHVCRDVLLAEPPTNCSVWMWTPPTPPMLPKWQQLEQAGTTPDPDRREP